MTTHVEMNWSGKRRTTNGNSIPVTFSKLFTMNAMSSPAYELVRPTTCVTRAGRDDRPRAAKPTTANAYVPIATRRNGQRFSLIVTLKTAADAHVKVTSTKYTRPARL